MYVHEWMSHTPVTIDEDAPVDEALHVLQTFGTTAMLVVRGPRIVGLAVESDLLQARALGPGTLGRLRLRDAVRPPGLAISPEDTLERAARIMEEHDVPLLPVLAEGRLVGSLSHSDVMRAFRASLGEPGSGARVVFHLDCPETVASNEDVLAGLVRRLRGFIVQNLVVRRSGGATYEVVARVRGRDDGHRREASA